MNIKVGDTVRVVNAKDTFGDYQNGDTATVVEAGNLGFDVEWVKRTPAHGTYGEICTFLYVREVELHESAETPDLSDWAKHYAISPAALEALTKLLGTESRE